MKQKFSLNDKTQKSTVLFIIFLACFGVAQAAEIATETVKNYINEDSRIKKVIFMSATILDINGFLTI